MAKYPEITQELSKNLEQLKSGIPEVIKSFYSMVGATNTEGALSHKTKELIATAIAVTARCEGCIAFHMRTLVQQGTTREELMEMLAVAIYMGGGPSMMYAAEAVQAFDEFSKK